MQTSFSLYDIILVNELLKKLVNQARLSVWLMLIELMEVFGCHLSFALSNVQATDIGIHKNFSDSWLLYSCILIKFVF